MSATILLPSIGDKEAPSPAAVDPKPLFPADMPVSYNAAGELASRYGDPNWDLRSMSTDGTSRLTLHFYCPDLTRPSPSQLLLREQHKGLMWLHMDAGKLRSWSAIQQANLVLTAWCKIAARRCVDLYTVLSNPEWVAEGVQDLNANYVESTSSVLQTSGATEMNCGLRWACNCRPYARY